MNRTGYCLPPQSDFFIADEGVHDRDGAFVRILQGKDEGSVEEYVCVMHV